MFLVLIFPVIGFLLMVIPLFNYISLKNKIASGTYMVAEGEVVDFKTIVDNSDDGGTTYAPIYEFSANGKTYRCVSTSSSSWRSRKPRKIAYNPNDPLDNKVIGDNFFVIIIGIVFFVAGLFAAFSAFGE